MPSLLPPVYVTLQVAVVYDPTLPDGAARLLAQIVGLHWQDPKPPITIDLLVAISGKSRSSVYGQLAQLADTGWLPFSTGADGTLYFDLAPIQSKVLDTSLLIKLFLY